MSGLIRSANTADLDAIYALAKDFAASFVVEREAFRRVFERLLLESNTALFVVEHNAVVLSYCLAFDHDTFFANGRVSWVEEITIHPTHRGQGLGRTLMEAVERWAEQRDSKLVALATRRASAFYRALGYEESATYFRKVL